MWKPASLILCVAVSTAGCATDSRPLECVWVEPIRPSRADVLTDGTARQILVHNETWERLCQ